MRDGGSAAPAAAPLISVFDLFSIGIGPSSSHTVGPMRAARLFVTELATSGVLERTHAIAAELFGSLAATGRGHGTDRAIVLGLQGFEPETVDPAEAASAYDKAVASGELVLVGGRSVPFDTDVIRFNKRRVLPLHSNGMRFVAIDSAARPLVSRELYSVGGGFLLDPLAGGASTADEPVPFPFRTTADLLKACAHHDLTVSDVVLRNELTRRTASDIRKGILRIWQVMQDCVDAGLHAEGVLPGRLSVPRRASVLYGALKSEAAGDAESPLAAMEWLNVYALAVNEENAAGGRVVTAPTNGAAGVLPAVLHYYRDFVPGASDEGVVVFFLTAAAIGSIIKQTASISGAEVGCQGEIGAACAMAAAGLCAVLGGHPRQVENAAEIALEHNLGLTCDPVAGLVQIPCIERNAVAAVKAVDSAAIALRGNGHHLVSLDMAIETMRQTGLDMKSKYKETARGGLGVHQIEC